MALAGNSFGQNSNSRKGSTTTVAPSPHIHAHTDLLTPARLPTGRACCALTRAPGPPQGPTGASYPAPSPDSKGHLRPAERQTHGLQALEIPANSSSPRGDSGTQRNTTNLILGGGRDPEFTRFCPCLQGVNLYSISRELMASMHQSRAVYTRPGGAPFPQVDFGNA